jgi:hypothetical protein
MVLTLSAMIDLLKQTFGWVPAWPIKMETSIGAEF